ncbi:MAG: hypothetical protein G01um10142_10 [Parcubacteria group bacterium Gr01-1014_2]|nr:MAG: hypothetical protein G01um10142_10 [Parcubacteria group bacterium Gr01-1014_2]
MSKQEHFPIVSKASDLNPVKQTRIQEVLFGQTELAAARSKRMGLLEIIRSLSTWPRRIIFIRRLRNL